jgi:hypothetical protein
MERIDMTENLSLFSKLKTTTEGENFPRLIGWIVLLAGTWGFWVPIIGSLTYGYLVRPNSTAARLIENSCLYTASGAIVAALLMIVLGWGDQKSRILACIGAFFGLLFILISYLMARAMSQIMRF